MMRLTMKKFNIFGVHWKIQAVEGGGGGAWQEIGRWFLKVGVNNLMHTLVTGDFSKKSFLLLLVFLRNPFEQS